MSVWAAAGLLLTLATGLSALGRTRRPRANFYASTVYGMTRRTHAAYAAPAFALAAVFAVSYFVRGLPVVPLLGASVLLAIFYFTSFLRGFSDEEEP